MATTFEANALAVLIGSLPVSAHEEANRLVMKYTPDIPLWVQLPAYKKRRRHDVSVSAGYAGADR